MEFENQINENEFLENKESIKINKKNIIKALIILIVGIALAIIILLIIYNDSKGEENQKKGNNGGKNEAFKIRLKNWEFGSTEK